MKQKIRLGFLIGTAALLAFACSDDKGGGSSTDSTISGKVTSLTVSSLARDGLSAMSTKTITHVMAVSPSTSSQESHIASVSSDGSFSLGLDSGQPYIVVFVAQDGSLTGSDMIAGVVRVSSNDLDTIGITEPANVDMGDVNVNGTTGEAGMSTTVDDLLAALGMTAGEAAYIGSVDDLALRLANPDIDGNGTIDALESKNFGMDWHVRADTTISGVELKVSDIENAFADASTLTLDWTLASGYAVYPKSLDNTTYVQNSGQSTVLINGGAFTSTDSGTIPPTSMSEGTFGDMHQWGPDYDMTSGEMGGSSGSATFVYTLGASSTTLTFTNVLTKPVAQLNADGVMLPFVKINTTGGKVTGIGYKWMKRSGSAWVAATLKEVNLLVQDSSAFFALYTEKTSSSSKALGFTIPSTSITGTVNIVGDSNFNNDGVTDPTNVTLSDICNTALSYDDKLGLRLFAGSPVASDGVTRCS